MPYGLPYPPNYAWGNAAAADADPTDPAEPAADMQLGAVTLNLRGCGVRPVTMAHMVLRAEDPLGCCVELDYAAWPYRRDGEALVMRTPDGCGLRLVPRRSTPA